MHQNTLGAQSGRMSGKTARSGFRSLATVLAQLSTNPDSLIPSRIAAFITAYQTQAAMPKQINPQAKNQMACLKSSFCNCCNVCICVSAPVVRSWPFMVSEAATRTARGEATAASGAAIVPPVGNTGGTYSPGRTV